MRTILLFDPTPDEPDPERGHPGGGQHYELMPNDADVLVLWREWGEQFKGGYRDHTFAQGIFENVTSDEVDTIIAAATGRLESP